MLCSEKLMIFRCELILFFLFVLASFTDYLDGFLARLYKEESRFGELLDPIADKILVSADLILLDCAIVPL